MNLGSRSSASYNCHAINVDCHFGYTTVQEGYGIPAYINRVTAGYIVNAIASTEKKMNRVIVRDAIHNPEMLSGILDIISLLDVRTSFIIGWFPLTNSEITNAVD